MSIKIETTKITNTLVKWTIAIPRLGYVLKSPSFQLFGCSWELNFATKINDAWSLTLKTNDKNPERFHLTVFIRGIGRDYSLSDVIISQKITDVWNTTYSLFRQLFPSIEVDGTHLEFKFLFCTSKLDPEISIKVEKSVQTSDLNTEYPENLPCLENLSRDLSKLVEGGSDTDVQLKCGDASIGAHKMILGARSEVFRTMMQNDMVEGREGIVEIIDMEPKILKIFIRYIYTGILPELPMDTALPIYEAADKYQVEALKKRSSQFLVKNLSPENALAILVAADAHSDSELKDQLVSYISEEKIPSRDVEWLKFCNEYPKLAVEVLNFMMYEVFPSNS